MPEVKEPTKELIESVIETGNLDDLLLLQETSWFEFREKHYATQAPEPGGFKAKYELAKDCSSIANSGGGYIFIGLKPEISESQMTEYVSSVAGVTKADINLMSWRDSLMNALTPRFTLEDIEHGFIDIDDTKSVLWMRIPSAEEKGVYPLVLHSDQSQVGEHRIKGRVIGVYERHGAENVLLSVEKIQSYIAQGISGENTGQPYSQAITRLEDKVNTLLEQQTATVPSLDVSERQKKLNEAARQKLGEDNEGYFYIYAAPKSNVALPNFWNPYTEEDSIPRLMKNPPALRNMGWDLSVSMQEYPSAEPGAWEITNGNRKLLDVTEKGEVFAAVTLSRFLDWGLEETAQREGYGFLLNAYAFAEYIAMYLSFVEKVAERLQPEGEEVKYQLAFGFVDTDGISIGLHEPTLPGIPSNGTVGPLRSPSAWVIDEIKPSEPYVNAGFVMQQITRAGFGGSRDLEYFIRTDGRLVFDPTSYARM